MPDENVRRDQNRVTAMLGQNASGDFRAVKMTDVTDRVLVEAAINGDANVVKIEGQIDSNNSTATPLPADTGGDDHIFTGTATDILNFGIVFINVFSDVASATDGLAIEQSSDGTNWDHDDVYTVPSNTGKNYSINPYARFVRVVYTNGTGAQSDFRLQTIIKGNSKPSSHRIQDSIVDEDDAELVKSVLSAKANGGGFVNIQATASDNLRVTDAESGLAIAKGDVVGTTFVHKFGNAPDFATTDGKITIWDGADEADIDQMVYVYSATAIIDSLSSDSGSDTQDILVQGLDTNFDLVTQTITITGQTRKALDTDLIRVFRMVNTNSTDNVGHIYCYEDTELSTGTPIDSTKIRAVMQPGNNQTLMAVYTIPNGKTGYMRSWYAATAGANRTSNYEIDVRARPIGEVFQLKHRTSIQDNGTSHIQHKYEEPEVFAAKTDIEMRGNVTAAGVTSASLSAGFDIVLIDD